MQLDIRVLKIPSIFSIKLPQVITCSFKPKLEYHFGVNFWNVTLLVMHYLKAV